MMAIPPLNGQLYENGYIHSDSDGSWVYNAQQNSWEGINGESRYLNETVNLDGPLIKTRDNSLQGTANRAYNNILSTEEGRATYGKMQDAKREGEIGLVAGAAVLASLPVTTTGGLTVLGTKALISITAQVVVNKDVDLIDVTADTFAVPGGSGLIGGKYNYNISNMTLETSTDTNAILFNGVTSTLGAGLGNRTDKIINGGAKSGLENTIGTVTNTVTSLLEQEVNKIYGNNNKK
ncbi:hypothetical protein IF128_06535 [Empedobacter stercoris]|uniref:hypothetical protein n=1 Tax=Empedobacter stercoris TaxID=1628248 RepID=UPI0016627071|nr:hypothetical protein [Empedobacter stercoris]MCA4777283.1 hypothetical protein [Empedobacter stercoris]MCA4809399.1 hypothetical protein [Empedobacter stercoris]